MADSKKTSVIAVFSLAVIFVLVLLAWNRPVQVRVPAFGEPQLTRAEEGEFVATLPREFILDASAAPKESRTVMIEGEEMETTENYSIRYPDGILQSTGNYKSQKSLLELAGAYEKYLADNGWRIVNRTNYPSSRGLYAKKESNDMSVAIIDKGGFRDVSVSYISK